MIKKYKKEIIFFYVFAIAMMIIASFFDLKIDTILNNPTEPISLWFYATGEMPARLVLPLAGVVIFYLSEKTIAKLFGGVVCMGGSAYLGTHISNYMFKDENNLAFGVAFGLGIGVITMLAGKYIKIPNVLKKPLLIFAYAGIAVMAIEVGIVEVVKIFWGRPRFRAMKEIGDFSVFQQWYQFNGEKYKPLFEGAFEHPSNEVKSCPSGHTASAAVSFLAMLMPFCFDKFKNKTALCFSIGFIYTAIVAFTRMVLGAHFLSDVTIGAIITFTVTIIVMAIVDKIFKSQLEIE